MLLGKYIVMVDVFANHTCCWLFGVFFLCNIDLPQMYVTDRGIVLRVGLCFFGGCDCCFVDCGIGSLGMDGDIGSIDLGTWVGLFVGFGDWSLVVVDVASDD